jgi:hypothetical protein
MNSQELRALQEAYSQVYGLDEGRNTSLQALSRESEQRKADKKRGRPEAEVERDSRLMMGRFRPGASQGERAEGGREVLKARGKVPKKGGKDMFEHILEHLVAEGYADTNEAAIAIMANMSEDWREEIIEGKKEFPHKKVDRQVYDAMDSGETAGDSGNGAKQKRDYDRADKMRSVAAKHGGKTRA